MIYLIYWIVYLYYIVNQIRGDVKYWAVTNNIWDTENWDQSSLQEDCKALVFPVTMEAIFSVDSLNTSKIILPRYGSVILQDGDINFTNDKSSECIKILDKKPGNWFDPENWYFDSVNNAVPDMETVPCSYDDVVFTNSSSFNLFFPSASVSVKSLSIRGKQLSTQDFKEFLNTEAGMQFQMEDMYGDADTIKITGKECNDNSGCLCQESSYDFSEYCDKILKIRQQDVECLSPFTPINDCGLFCGGSVLLEIEEDTNIFRISKELDKYDDVDTYISRVNDKYIQVLFADFDRYDKTSAGRAKDFYNSVLDRRRFYSVKSVTLQTSGEPFFKGNAFQSALFIIFGTLTAVLLVMGSIYYVYVGPGQYKTYFPNFDLTGRYLSPFYFARFDNREGGVQFADEAEEIDNFGNRGTSNAFDNPMFGTATPLVTKRSDSVQTSATDVSTAEIAEHTEKTIEDGNEE